MKEQISLKPCPFCGGSAILEDNTWDGTGSTLQYQVRCLWCGALSTKCCPEEEAIKAWNRRYHDDDAD